jgi:hypothetical protein
MTIEQVREEYKRVIGNDVSNRYKNDIEWMQNKIDDKHALMQVDPEADVLPVNSNDETITDDLEWAEQSESDLTEQGDVETEAEESGEDKAVEKALEIDPEAGELAQASNPAERDMLDSFTKVQKYYGFSMSDLNNTDRLVKYFKVPEKHLKLVHEYLVSITPKKENPIITSRWSRDYIRPLKEKYGLNSSDFFDEAKIRAKVFADLKNYEDQEVAKAEKEAEVKTILQYSKAALWPIK